MHTSSVLLVALGASYVQANTDLACLGWGLLSPLLGVFCYVAPEKYNEAEQAAVNSVEAVVEDVKDLVKFDITHNPIAISYNYLTADDPNQYLHDTIDDYGNLTVGFAKETANQALTLMKFSYWYDLSMCYIKQGARENRAAQIAKRALPSTSEIAQKVINSCLTPGFNSLAAPKGFNITDPNQKVGATISDVATLFVPVVGEDVVAGRAAGEAATAGFDLAITGSEDATRIYKAVDETGAGEHFATEDEARAVGTRLEDGSWKEKNCRTCDVPVPVASIRRRTGMWGICCSLPDIVPESPFDSFDTPLDDLETPPAEPDSTLSPPPVHDPVKYENVVTETQLSDPPAYTSWDLDDPANIAGANDDLEKLNTAVIKWSNKLTAVTDSDAILATIKDAFELPENDMLYRNLRIKERNGRLRMTSFSSDWMQITDPSLDPFRNFVNAAVEDGINNIASLKGWSPAKVAEMKATGSIGGSVEFFYTAPTEQAIIGVDPRGLHQDGGFAQFAFADVEGLVIQNDIGSAEGAESWSRAPVGKNVFQMMKALRWDFEKLLTAGDSPNLVTSHTVFGEEMAKKGRLSVVMSIFNPKLPF